MAVRKAKAELVVARVHEASGSSRTSWESAAANAVEQAKSDVPDPVGLEVARLWADVKAGKPTLFHATVRIAYRLALKRPASAKRAKG